MSQHSSLKISSAGKRHRSVLKRYERLKHLKDKDEWNEDSSIFKLPKIKSIKVKIKKEKIVEEKAGEEVAAEAAAETSGTHSPRAKTEKEKK